MLKNKRTLIAIFLIIIFEIFIYAIQPIIEKYIKILTVISINLLIIGYFIYLKIKKEKYSIKHIIYLVIIIGILLRTMYIVYTPITERQHDLYGIKDEGHLGYIFTIYETGELPKTNNVQFYHPPLFHAISAGWLKLNDAFNVPLEKSLEGLQVITVIFSSMILLVTYKITNELKISDKYKLIVNTFMAVYPSFIILSGSINNDVLTILLQFCIILYLIKWDKEESYKNTIILALITGLCVMTKLSGAIMALPIMFVFIKRIVITLKKEKEKSLELFCKFLVFGLISLPLGLWHPIRNYILFNQPIGGVLIPAQKLYIGNYSNFQRFFSISFNQLFNEIYCNIPGDYNLLSYIIKCSIFGEFSYDNFELMATVMKSINLFLIIVQLFFTIKYIIGTKKSTFIVDLLLINWIANTISFYAFNIEYPYLCTMDFRYIVPTVFTGISIILIELENCNKKYIRKVIENIILVFIFLCGLMPFVIN